MGDFQKDIGMLHSKYGSCSINYPWAKVCNIYYMILKNVTVCFVINGLENGMCDYMMA